MWRPAPRSSAIIHLYRLLHPSSSYSSTLITSFPELHLISSIRFRPPFFSWFRSLASVPSSTEPSDLARTISVELSKLSSSSDSSTLLDLPRHFSLHFSDIRFNTPFLHEVLNISPSAGRTVIDFFRWLVRNRGFTPNDTSLSHLINYLGRRKDFKAVHEMLLEFRHGVGMETITAALDRLVRSGRASQAVHFFDCMEPDYGLKRNLPVLTFLVSSLCCHGFTGHAERLIKRLADTIFPTEQICYTLIRGYCDELKLDDARRLMGEIIRGGFDLTTPAYNSIIDCICRLCRKKDPSDCNQRRKSFFLRWNQSGFHEMGNLLHTYL
ncbi:hypothetical protein HPP92_008261 [Vanilla planifolia]|uniref:Pentatricopeptide repeat-containing protein n=1 Tax=Vanilla planifolia TaxID=51239 RepID=A0A835RE00_VANPL|nr:hypothetical protein HPP92_008261 [Vanilla planifolia]